MPAQWNSELLAGSFNGNNVKQIDTAIGGKWTLQSQQDFSLVKSFLSTGNETSQNYRRKKCMMLLFNITTEFEYVNIGVWINSDK